MEKLNLEDIRQGIDDIDKKLLELLEQRMDLVSRVAEYKRLNKMPVLDTNREKVLLDKIEKLVKNPLYKPALTETFKDIINHSKEYQKSILQKEALFESSKNSVNVLYQGETGCYGEEAAAVYFDNANLINAKTFSDVAKGVRDGVADFGVLPLENSSTGSIIEVYDILKEYDCYIAGEVVLKVNHCLLGLNNAKMSDIKMVYSHPQGFEQCSNFLKLHPNWECVPYHNTAVSAKYVSECKDVTKAAIASERAGDIFKLKTIKKDINNNYNNYTRFIIISAKMVSNENSNKISVVLQLIHRKGELYRAISHLERNGLNMLKIESRPIQGRSWEYSFYIDFEGNLSEVNTKNALNELKKNCNYFKLLGNYKAALI